MFLAKSASSPQFRAVISINSEFTFIMLQKQTIKKLCAIQSNPIRRYELKSPANLTTNMITIEIKPMDHALIS